MEPKRLALGLLAAAPAAGLAFTGIIASGHALLLTTVLAAALAGAAGAAYGRAEFTVAAAWVLLLLAGPLMVGAAGYLLLPSVVLFLLVSRALPTFRGPPQHAARALSVLALLVVATLLVPWLLSGDVQRAALPAALVVLLVTLLLLVVAWAPARRAAPA